MNRNIVSTTFNGLGFAYTLPEDKYLQFNPLEVRQALQAAIGFSSKSWQVEYALNNFFGIEGKLEVTTL